MSLQDQKINASDFSNKDVVSLPDKPSQGGYSASTLKTMFDAPSKQVVTPKFNGAIDILTSTSGASNIGATVTGLSGVNVQSLLASLKALVDARVTETEYESDMETKFDVTEAQKLVKAIAFNESTGVFTFTHYDGTKTTIDTALEKVALNCRLDGQQFVLTLADGTEQRVDLSAFLTQYETENTTSVSITLSSGKISASVNAKGISRSMLDDDLDGILTNAVEEASESAQIASDKATDASNSATLANTYMDNAFNYANDASSSYDNAREMRDEVEQMKNTAANSAQTATNNASYAAQQADRAIATVAGFAGDIVSTSDTQPTSIYNRLWFPGITQEVEFLTYADIGVVETIAHESVEAYLRDIDISEYIDVQDVTTTTHGLMVPADKIKLDALTYKFGIDQDGNPYMEEL